MLMSLPIKDSKVLQRCSKDALARTCTFLEMGIAQGVRAWKQHISATSEQIDLCVDFLALYQEVQDSTGYELVMFSSCQVVWRATTMISSS